MMGRRRRDQGKLFYEFRLDDRIPKDHLLRRIDVFVTAALADLHQELEAYYSDIGRNARNAFLRSPMELTRITSGFTMARFHPVMQDWREHKGVDYAAPQGTPVRVTA